MGLPGQAGGQAAANLLTGKAVPSGKLTETWPMQYEDVISKETFGKKNTEYREGIYVGYRYYDKAGKRVRYPFGYGLSYTEFVYSELTVNNRAVTVNIRNTGNVKGAEVVQLYISPPEGGIFRPAKELKGFARIELEPGEMTTVKFELDDRSFAVWSDGWKSPTGKYKVMIGASCQDIRLTEEIVVEGDVPDIPELLQDSWYESLNGSPKREEWESLMGHAVPILRSPQKGQFTMDSTCMEMLDSSFVMKIQYKVTENIIAKGFDGKKDMSDPAYRMMLNCAVDAPMRSVVISGEGRMSESLAKCLLEMANGHYIKGIKELLKK